MTSPRLKFALRCAVSLLLVFVVLRKVNFRDLGLIIGSIDARWAIVGSALTGLLIVGLAVRWRLFLAQQDIAVPLPRVISLTWAGQCFNSLLPGSTGGDVFKIFEACRMAPERKAAAAASVFTDRLSALIALLVLAGAGFLLEPAPVQMILARNASALNLWWLAAALVFGAVMLAILWRVLRSGPWLGRIGRTLAATFATLRFSGAIVAAFSLAFAVHLLNFFAVYCFAVALRIDISFPQVLLMMPVVLLLVMLPVTINGHGLRELLLIAYFSHMAISVAGRSDVGYTEVAVALSVLLVANDLLWALPGGIHYLARRRVDRGAEAVVPAL